MATSRYERKKASSKIATEPLRELMTQRGSMRSPYIAGGQYRDDGIVLFMGRLSLRFLPPTHPPMCERVLQQVSVRSLIAFALFSRHPFHPSDY